jgi:hypothetical protein
LEKDPDLAAKNVQKQIDLIVGPWNAAMQGKEVGLVAPVFVIYHAESIEKSCLGTTLFVGSHAKPIEKSYLGTTPLFYSFFPIC